MPRTPGESASAEYSSTSFWEPRRGHGAVSVCAGACEYVVAWKRCGRKSSTHRRVSVTKHASCMEREPTTTVDRTPRPAVNKAEGLRENVLTHRHGMSLRTTRRAAL